MRRLEILWNDQLVGYLEDIVPETVQLESRETLDFSSLHKRLPDGKYRVRYVALDTPPPSEFVAFLRKEPVVQVSDNSGRQWFLSLNARTKLGWLSK